MGKKGPTYEVEIGDATFGQPTGRLVCDCCFAVKGRGHKKHCYWRKSKRRERG